jgi:hypothetical protein
VRDQRRGRGRRARRSRAARAAGSLAKFGRSRRTSWPTTAAPSARDQGLQLVRVAADEEQAVAARGAERRDLGGDRGVGAEDQGASRACAYVPGGARRRRGARASVRGAPCDLDRLRVRRSGDAATTEDIVADAFLRAARARRQLTWRGVPLRGWLMRVASNELRARARRARGASVADDVPATPPAADHEALRDAIAGLPSELAGGDHAASTCRSARWPRSRRRWACRGHGEGRGSRAAARCCVSGCSAARPRRHDHAASPTRPTVRRRAGDAGPHGPRCAGARARVRRAAAALALAARSPCSWRSAARWPRP